MDTKKLSVLEKTVELASLSKAGEELGMTQSGVSHVIAALEEELGVSLLTRTRAGARLTPEGEKLMPYIRGVLGSERQLEEATAALRGLEMGTVRVATFTSVAVHWLPEMIKNFQLQYPNIEFRLHNGDYKDVDQWLADGSADIGFIALPTSLSCEVVPLLEDRLLAIVPKEHRLAALDRVPVEELAHEPFISLLDGSDNDARRAIAAANIRLNVKFTTKDDYAILAMVEHGLGVSIVPELLMEGQRQNFAARELVPPASRTIALAMPGDRAAAPSVVRFAEYVKAWVDEHYH